MSYTITTICKHCKHESVFEITKTEGSFDLAENISWNIPCEKCSSTEKSSLGTNKPTIDEELMEQWATQEELQFLDQDEDLYIAVVDNIDLIIHFLDAEKTLPAKKNVLLDALCVLLYDNVKDMEELSKKEKQLRKDNLEILLPRIIERKDLILQNKELIYKYVFEVVEPYLK